MTLLPRNHELTDIASYAPGRVDAADHIALRFIHDGRDLPFLRSQADRSHNPWGEANREAA